MAWSSGRTVRDGYLLRQRHVGQDGNNYMDIADLHAALQVAPDLDFLFFDACFMEAVEVAYALARLRNYLISSPTEIPGPGAALSDSGSRDVFCRKCSFEDRFLLL